ADPEHLPAPGPLKAEQSHTSVTFGNQLLLKVYRRVEEGPHPELEIGRYLTAQGFPHTPPFLGAVELRKRRGAFMVLAILRKFIPNTGEAWQYTLDELSSFFERALAEQSRPDVKQAAPRIASIIGLETPELARRLIGAYLESAALLGRRTAE